jgi:hypothetical protein
MALSSDEEKRVQAIESALATHTTAIKNLASKAQLTHILSLVQRDLDEIRDAITSLESQIKALKK